MAYGYGVNYPQFNGYNFNQQNVPQRYSITRVNGENGARSFQMMPNSETILLDTTQPVIWLAQTDGAGYLTVTPFDIKEHHESPPVDIRSLEERLKKLEDAVNGKSDLDKAGTGPGAKLTTE